MGRLGTSDYVQGPLGTETIMCHDFYAQEQKKFFLKQNLQIVFKKNFFYCMFAKFFFWKRLGARSVRADIL